MSRSASKHVHFALGVDPTARDASEGGSSDLISQAMPFTVSCETYSRPCSLATQVQTYNCYHTLWLLHGLTELRYNQLMLQFQSMGPPPCFTCTSDHTHYIVSFQYSATLVHANREIQTICTVHGKIEPVQGERSVFLFVFLCKEGEKVPTNGYISIASHSRPMSISPIPPFLHASTKRIFTVSDITSHKFDEGYFCQTVFLQ